MNRRGFLIGLLTAAPAIVAAPSLMRISTAALSIPAPPPLVAAADRYVSDYGTISLQTRDFTETLLRKTIKEVWDSGGDIEALVINPKLIPADWKTTQVEPGRWLAWRENPDNWIAA
jgi:hypothetical protein